MIAKEAVAMRPSRVVMACAVAALMACAVAGIAVGCAATAGGAHALSPVAREAGMHHVATGQQPTRVVVFEPWTRAGLARGIRVAATVRGSCWSTAIAAPRPGAYRCMEHNEIFDPCFADRYTSQGSGVVACPDPGPATVVIMELTQPLPRFWPPATPAWPWLIILASGVRCFDQTGATLYTKGIGRLDYACGTGSRIYGVGTLWGASRGGRTWTILYQRRLGGSFTRVPIAAVYE
jgi:hypothetical protein